MRWAFAFGVVLALALPKRVECGFPGGAGSCTTAGMLGTVCRTYELEPFGLYLVELVAKQDVGFAYSTTEDCR